MADKLKRLQVSITGRVQGVFYRASTQKAAQGLGISGWVKNMPDGSVAAEFQGNSGQIDSMLAWCRQGPAMARVDDIKITERPPDPGQTTFSVRY